MTARRTKAALPLTAGDTAVAVDRLDPTVYRAVVRRVASRIEVDLGIATPLHDLQTWISQAKDLLERGRFAAENDKALDEKPAQRGVMAYSACWEEDQADGLDTLNTEISARLDCVANAVGLKSEGALK